MGAQFITTEQGEELVLLSRRDYDALLASLGDEEAEDRITVRLADASKARIASGDDPEPIPSDLVYAILDSASPLRAIRLHRDWDIADLARTTGLSADVVTSIDDGTREAAPAERVSLGQALEVDPRWLEPL